jgi:hypothetical protein
VECALFDVQHALSILRWAPQLLKFQIQASTLGTNRPSEQHLANVRSWPKALVPKNTMKVCYREITWLPGESY